MKRIVLLAASAAVLVQFTKNDLTALQTLGCEIHMVCDLQQPAVSAAALHAFNQTFPKLIWHDIPFSDNALSLLQNHRAKQALTALLKELFGSTGTDVYVEPNFRCDYGYNIHVGEGFYANYDCIMLDSAPITIGDGCMFGPRVSLITATHPVEAERRCWRDDIPYEGEYARPITIGDQVWLGAGVIVNPGVTIGDRAVIASGSVVTRDIPADSLAAGVPAVVKKRLNSV